MKNNLDGQEVQTHFFKHESLWCLIFETQKRSFPDILKCLLKRVTLTVAPLKRQVRYSIAALFFLLYDNGIRILLHKKSIALDRLLYIARITSDTMLSNIIVLTVLFVQQPCEASMCAGFCSGQY